MLFVGPRGTGKTSLARILAKAINCTNLQDGDPCDACPSCVAIREGRAMDLLEIDAASNRGIDAIRDLRERINYAPTDLRRKVYILDEAHQITKDAWNALLKSLEEPPDFVVFMFASTHPQEFPPAILSRLQRFDVRRLTTDEIEGKLRRILEADGRTATPEAVHLIARLAAGGMRDAESMLDQLLSSSADGLDEARVRDLLGLADVETVDGFVDALVDGDAARGHAPARRARGARARPARLPRPGHRGAPGGIIGAPPAGTAQRRSHDPRRDGPRRGGEAAGLDRSESRRRRWPAPSARAGALPGSGPGPRASRRSRWRPGAAPAAPSDAGTPAGAGPAGPTVDAAGTDSRSSPRRREAEPRKPAARSHADGACPIRADASQPARRPGPRRPAPHPALRRAGAAPAETQAAAAARR